MSLQRNLILVFSILIQSGIAAAQSFDVTEVNSKSTRVKVKTNDAILKGDYLKHTDSFGEECVAKAVKVDAGIAVLDISKCENAESIKAGTRFSRTTAPIEQPMPGQAQSRSSTGGPTIDEPWYTLWALGFAKVNYDDNGLNDAIDDADDSGGVDRSTYAYDFFGFYWPTASKKAMQGFVINTVVDSLDGPGGNIDIIQYQYSYSYHHFFGANIGDGWFLRGDVGLAKYVVDISVFGNLLNGSYDTDMGIGILGGGGYGFAIGQETRLLLGAYMSVRDADDFKAANFNFNFGFLF